MGDLRLMWKKGLWLGLAVLGLPSLAGAQEAKVVGMYTLPPMDLKMLNPHLFEEDIREAQARGWAKVDQPGIGSGLFYLGNGRFLGLTDRGPNGDCPGGKFFPLPRFAPALLPFRLEEATGRIRLEAPVSDRRPGPRDAGVHGGGGVGSGDEGQTLAPELNQVFSQEKSGRHVVDPHQVEVAPLGELPEVPIQQDHREPLESQGLGKNPVGLLAIRDQFEGGEKDAADPPGDEVTAQAAGTLEIQFLARRGYAVLQVNYRGSGGYGRDFINRGRHQWGRAMQDDLTDGVKWAVAEGIADPARIAIYGASYGGYATLAGLTLTPELYRCGVNYVGASDLEITFKHRGDDAYREAGEFSYREEWVGPTEEYRAQPPP